ncbi:MAG TPA: trehalase-like domain-containing protein, partial [Streptosporangiaceae bacterium]|nr:trehalase-like domain-containing protein [Streptosporangiaceae bacterium]
MTVPSTADAFPPHVLREYALIADGERGALVGPRGDIVWMCAPRWHSDAVFAALIGGGGAYAVTPEDRFVWGGYYEPGALIWRSRWITCDAIVECREALAFPGDAHRVVVLRHVMAREGTAKVNVVLDPRAGFTGPGLQSLHQDDLGHWHARLGALYVRWAGDVGGARTGQTGTGSGLTLTLMLRPGEERDLTLEVSDRPFGHQAASPAWLWHATQRHWEHAVPSLAGIT